MGTSVGAAIDYFAGAAMLAAFQVVDPDVVLADNFSEDDWTSSLVAIGREGPDAPFAVQSAANDFVDLGAQRLQESYELHGFIQGLRDGPAQKDARDLVLGHYDALVKFIRADLTLGGLLNRGRVGIVNRFSLQQTADPKDSRGGAMRFAHLDFTIAIQNTYLP